MADKYRDDVYELQCNLRKLSLSGEDIPLLIPDGIYGDATAEAVKRFQGLCGLAETGVVDYETWLAAKDECRRVECALSPGLPIAAFPSFDYSVCDGECSDTVMMIQLMLSALSVAYDCFYDVPQNGIYDEDTVNCVLHFQKINRLPETGVVDKATWDALVKNYNVFANHAGYTG